MRNRNIILAVVAVIVLAAGIFAYVQGSDTSKGPEHPWQPPADMSEGDQPPADITYATVPVTAGSKTFDLQIADTSDKQQLGLGKRKTIGGDGMIFPYTKPQRLCFWMKDMHFAIDMIWLDAGKKVVQIQPDVQPDSYPRKNYCVENAQYVVELGSGVAADTGIKTGDALSFDL